MKARALLIPLCLALLLGCQRQQPPQVQTEGAAAALQPLGPAPEGILLSEDCRSAPDWSPPRPGDSFTYLVLGKDGQPDPAVQRKDIVEAVDGPVITYLVEMESAGIVLERSREQTLLGILPGRGQTRQWTYPGLNADQVRALTPGSRLTFIGREVVELDSATQSHEEPISITFVGCGRATERIPGAAGDILRIYRLERFWQTSSGVQRGQYEVAVSAKRGWRMMDRDSGGVGVVTEAP
jgi:hypothetical protein